jgi:hypothetical protein
MVRMLSDDERLAGVRAQDWTGVPTVDRLEAADATDNEEQTFRGVVFLDGEPVLAARACASEGWVECGKRKPGTGGSWFPEFVVEDGEIVMERLTGDVVIYRLDRQNRPMRNPGV